MNAGPNSDLRDAFPPLLSLSMCATCTLPDVTWDAHQPVTGDWGGGWGIRQKEAVGWWLGRKFYYNCQSICVRVRLLSGICARADHKELEKITGVRRYLSWEAVRIIEKKIDWRQVNNKLPDLMPLTSEVNVERWLLSWKQNKLRESYIVGLSGKRLSCASRNGGVAISRSGILRCSGSGFLCHVSVACDDGGT